MNFQYIDAEQADLYSFIRIPKELVTNDFFSSLSSSSKMLYGLLIDRMAMSVRNRWTDEEHRVYVIYPVSEMQEDLNLSNRKILCCLAELEKTGLIERQKRGHGLPSIIYVKNFSVQNAS